MAKLINVFIIFSVIINGLINEIQTQDITQTCLQCICKASSGCNLNTKCHNSGPNAYFCGPYQISWAYWSDAGKPGNTGRSDDFEHCLNDKNCAEVTVRGYMTKWQKDCNNDGVIDCLDFAAIHKAGASSCDQQWLYNSQYWNVFRQCQISASDASTQPELNNNKPWAPSQPQTNHNPQTYPPPHSQPHPTESWPQPQPQPRPSLKPVPKPTDSYSPQPINDPWNQPQPRPVLKPQNEAQPDPNYNPPQPTNDEYWDSPQPNSPQIPPQPQPLPPSGPSLEPYPNDPYIPNQPQSRPTLKPTPSQPNNADPWDTPSAQPNDGSIVQPYPGDSSVPYNPSNPGVGEDPWDAVSRAVDELSRPTPQPQVNPSNSWSADPPSPASPHSAIPGRAPTQPVSWATNNSPTNSFGQPFQPNEGNEHNSQPPSPSTSHSASPTPDLIEVPTNGSADQNCLECICEASSDCDLNKQCEGSYCGPYLISWAYWSDAGQPGGDYVTCANNKACAQQAVQGYMNKWQRDCNGDGLIDCTDFAAIHKLGPHSCNSEAIHGTDYWTSYQSCKSPSIDARRLPTEPKPPTSARLTGRSVPQSVPSTNTFVEYPNPIYSNPIQTDGNPVTREEANHFGTDSRISFPSDRHINTNREPVSTSITRTHNTIPSPDNPISVNNSVNERAFEQLGLNRECLDCICQASSKCNPSIGCQNDGSGGYLCGPYQMSWAHWSDAGKPGIRGNLENLENFQSCLNNKECAEATLYGYLRKWKKDCNEDRNINCYDFAALHMAGPTNCNAQWLLDSQYWADFHNCFDFRRK